MNLLAVSEAAERLGVTTRQVQHLVARGELRRLARGVVDEASVERLLAVRGGSHKQAWSGSTAWAAVALLSGMTPNWMGGSQRSRLRARLRATAAARLVERTRLRAEASRYSGHPSTAARLRAELIDTTAAAPRLGLAEANAVDAYVDARRVAGVVARHGLIRDDGGHFTLRATTFDLDVVAEIAERDVVLAALDLAESLEVRERRAGLDALDAALERHRA